MRVVLNGSRRQFWASGRTCSRAPQLLAGATCRPPYGSVAEGAPGVCRPAAESTHTRHLQHKSVLINWDSRHPSLWREPSTAFPALSSSAAAAPSGKLRAQCCVGVPASFLGSSQLSNSTTPTTVATSNRSSWFCNNSRLTLGTC